MQVAVIPPAVQAALPYVAGRSIYLALAQYVLKYDWYIQFFRDQQQAGAHIIMDNGAAEEVKLSDADLRTAVDLLEPNEVVLPDIIGDAYGTLRASLQFLLHDAAPPVAYMYVVHDLEGTRLVVPEACTVGVSKFARCSRATLIDHLAPYSRVHLLGFVDIAELLYLARRYQNIRSVDTAWPYLAAEAQVPISSPRPMQMVCDLDYFDEHTGPTVILNIREMESYAHGETPRSEL